MSELQKPGIKARLFESGMIEVSGDDPDNIALTLDGIARLRGQHQAKPAELPLSNGAAVELPAANRIDRSPFIDASVSQNHPAIQKLEQQIRQAKPGSEFEYRVMQEHVGFFITGVKRQCKTRAIGHLMARLSADGVVTQAGRDVWKRAALKVK